MGDRSDDVGAEYLDGLRAFLQTGGEPALSRAYETGRRALSEGRGLVEVLCAHQQAIERLGAGASAADQAHREAKAWPFLCELLSPYDAALRARADATEEVRRLTEALRRQKEFADSANRELDSFTYCVSHDLRAPLRSIEGFSHVLLEDFADQVDEQGKTFLQYLGDSARKMAQLIDELVRLARITRTELAWESIDLSRRVHEVVDRLRRAHPARQVDLVVEDGVVARGDARLLGLVVEQLVSNAWKFTSKCERARIEFGRRHERCEIVYFVRDDGAGFDMAYSSKLFGVFQRLHPPDEFPGNGIGLATVQRAIHKHRGRVTAEGTIGRGATFLFTLGDDDGDRGPPA